MATNTSVFELGAKPVFADIQYDTLNIDPQSVAEKITDKTKAIICVHYAGNAVDLNELRDVANAHNLPIIEDSAHAMASEYQGKSNWIYWRHGMFFFSMCENRNMW